MKPDLARYPEAARRVDSNSNKTAESPGQKESMLLSSETVTATTISTVSAARHTLSSLWVLLGLGVASPILLPFGFLMLPFILGIVAYGYIVAIIVYLLTVQTEHPKAKNSVLPILPLHPYRVFKINAALFDHVIGLLFGPVTPISMRWMIRKALSRRIGGYTVICKDIHYVKTKPHLTLDIHCSETIGEGTPLRPVIIFIYGGAWSSGNKSMYIPLAETLQEAGYVVVVPNYSTFPKGKIGDMVYDIAHAIHWSHNNIKTYGGDSSQIHLMGHSAGAHLCALTVIHDMVAYIENGFPNENLKVPRLSNLPVLEDCLPQIQGLILLAGVFDINTHFQHESKRCVEEVSAMARVMGSTKTGFDNSSPCVILKRLNYDLLRTGEVSRLLPKNWLIVHGDIDTTVPLRESQELYRILKHDVGVQSVRLKIYPRIDHVRPVAELMLPDSDYSLSFLTELAAHIRDSRESIGAQFDKLGHVLIDGKYHYSATPGLVKDFEARSTRA